MPWLAQRVMDQGVWLLGFNPPPRLQSPLLLTGCGLGVFVLHFNPWQIHADLCGQTPVDLFVDPCQPTNTIMMTEQVWVCSASLSFCNAIFNRLPRSQALSEASLALPLVARLPYQRWYEMPWQINPCHRPRSLK